jgi:hypothetical protein
MGSRERGGLERREAGAPWEGKGRGAIGREGILENKGIKCGEDG